ncbi:MAG: hypothetical protein IJA32_08150 [Lachnospiraceae bacterium]|nr:hypothetical protein [Lachnospiraceae bacterium]
MSNKKVVKYKRRRTQINIGLAIFSVIFIYILIQVIRALGKEQKSIYEVTRSSIDNNITLTALAIREENVVTTTNAGYISYYIKDLNRASKSDIVYSIDQTGDVSNKITTENDGTITLSKEDYSSIRNEISLFQIDFDLNEYNDIYDFKLDLENTIMEISNENALANLDQDITSSASATFQLFQNTQAGIVAFYVDGYESKTLETLTAADFDEESYEKTRMTSGDLIAANSPVYKIITSDDWHLVCEITESQRQKLEQLSKVKLYIPRDKSTVIADFSIVEQNGMILADFQMNKNMARFADCRFLDIEIIMEDFEGLKIPNTAIVKKDFYKVPVYYLTQGANSSDSLQFNRQAWDDENGVYLEPQVVELPIYYMDSEYCYINPNDVHPNDILIRENSTQTLRIGECVYGQLEGVYSVNKGYATFKRIVILDQNTDYAIIKEGVDYSIAMYDHIIIDSTTIEENAIIY